MVCAPINKPLNIENWNYSIRTVQTFIIKLVENDAKHTSPQTDFNYNSKANGVQYELSKNTSGQSIGLMKGNRRNNLVNKSKEMRCVEFLETIEILTMLNVVQNAEDSEVLKPKIIISMIIIIMMKKWIHRKN